MRPCLQSVSSRARSGSRCTLWRPLPRQHPQPAAQPSPPPPSQSEWAVTGDQARRLYVACLISWLCNCDEGCEAYSGSFKGLKRSATNTGALHSVSHAAAMSSPTEPLTPEWMPSLRGAATRCGGAMASHPPLRCRALQRRLQLMRVSGLGSGGAGSGRASALAQDWRRVPWGSLKRAGQQRTQHICSVIVAQAQSTLI